MSGSIRALSADIADLRADIVAFKKWTWERISQLAAEIAALADQQRSTDEELRVRCPVVGDAPVPSPPRDFVDLRVRLGAAERLLEALARRVAALELRVVVVPGHD